MDLGCGTGAYLPLLTRFAREVVGVDIAPAMLEEVSKNLFAKTVALIQASATSLPFPDKHFDFGICVGVLEYFDKPGEVLREVFRIMKPGGQVVFTLPNVTGVGRITGLPRTITLMVPPRWKIAVGAFLNRILGHQPDHSKYYLGACFTRGKIRCLCRTVGLEVTRISYSGYQDLSVLGIALPSIVTTRFAGFAEKQRHTFPWKYLGDNLIVTIQKPGAKTLLQSNELQV